MSTTANIDVGNTWTELVDPVAGTTNVSIGNASGAKMEIYVDTVAPTETDTGYTIRGFNTDDIPAFAGGIWARCTDLLDTVTVTAVVVAY